MRPHYSRLLTLIFCCLLFTHCRQPAKPVSGLLNPGNIPSFSVQIDITRDTVIHAPGGSLIHIPANALDAAGSSSVRLIIKEAIRMSDIVRAGLLTSSNEQPLSSGGMIDIEVAAGQTVRITRPVEVSMPTPELEKNMQLYKGLADDKGKIDWTDPKPLSDNPQMRNLDSGTSIFQTHCASCHSYGKDITGPSLAYISRRRDKKWLYDFTRNSAFMISTGDRYARCLYQQYNKTPMNAFPLLTDKELAALYTYIDNESSRLGLPLPDDHFKKCVDSCARYEQEESLLQQRRAKLIAGNGPKVTANMRQPAGYVSPDTGKVIMKVQPKFFQPVYYQFRIESFGWYNVDIVLKNRDGVRESELMVRLRGEYKDVVNVFLVIPSARVFEEGGRLDGKEDEYGFYTGDGRIPLPQDVGAFILVMGEQEDKLVFSLTSFQTSLKQTLEMQPQPFTKEAVNAELQRLNLQEIRQMVLDATNADSIRSVDSQLKEIESLMPKNCNCHCGLISDTSTTGIGGR